MRPRSRDAWCPALHPAARLTPTNPGSDPMPLVFALLFFLPAAGYLTG